MNEHINIRRNLIHSTIMRDALGVDQKTEAAVSEYLGNSRAGVEFRDAMRNLRSMFSSEDAKIVEMALAKYNSKNGWNPVS